MINFNSYLLRHHNDFFTLQDEEKSLYKADHYDEMKNGLISQIKCSSIKAHHFESVINEGNNKDIDDINNFLLSIGEENVVVNSDPNALLFRNILDYDMFNYDVNYQRDYVFDLPHTEIRTVNQKINHYKFSSPIYYIIDKICDEILSDKSQNHSLEKIKSTLEDYLPNMYNDVLLKGQLMNKAFVFKKYINEEVITNVIVPNEKLARKVSFYNFNEFVKNETTKEYDILEELKNYHKNELLKYLNKNNGNIILFKRKQ